MVAGVSHRDDMTRPPPSRLPATKDEDLTLRERWLALTRTKMPSVAHAREWPVTADHCFQRILLDNACGGCWYDYITERPAWRHAPIATIRRAVTLGEAALAGDVDLAMLNRRSLDWRRQRKARPAPEDRS